MHKKTRITNKGFEKIIKMTDHEKLKALMKERGLSYYDIAEITGHSYNSVKSMLQPNKEIPRWVKLVLYVWDGK